MLVDNSRTYGVVVPDPDNAANRVLSFNSTVPFTGGGDLFTQGLFTTPTGTDGLLHRGAHA